MGPHCSDFTAANFADFAGAPRPVELRVPQFTYLCQIQNKVAVFIEKKTKFNGAFYIKNAQWVKKVGKAQ